MLSNLEAALEFSARMSTPHPLRANKAEPSPREDLKEFDLSEGFLIVAENVSLNGLAIGNLIVGNPLKPDLHSALSELNGPTGRACIPDGMVCIGSWEANALAVNSAHPGHSADDVYAIELWRGPEARPQTLAPNLSMLLTAAANHWQLVRGDSEDWRDMSQRLDQLGGFSTAMRRQWRALWESGC
ncbi:MAG: hypothetical protein AAGH68_12210 [Pseudomonadota bacterium]